MDARLESKLGKWHDTIGSLKEVELKCLQMEAHEKPLWGQLFLKAEGKNVAEKEAAVYSNQEWRNFTGGLAEAKSAVNHEKRLLELRQAAFNAEYLDCKMSGEAIQRMPKGMT